MSLDLLIRSGTVYDGNVEQLPHAPMWVYVMGERGLDRELTTI